MTLIDSFLADAGWLFFAAWSVVVAAVSITAFGGDLLAGSARRDATAKSHTPDPVAPNQPIVR